MSAAARAASVAPETAMPASAFFRAGASFTPSPVMPTMWPRVCSTSHDVVLVLGKHLREAVRALDGLGRGRRRHAARRRPSMPASRMFVAQPDLAGDLPGDGDLVAGDHLHARRPSVAAAAMVALASSRGGSNKRQHAQQLPVAVAVGPRHARASGSRARRSRSTAFVDSAAAPRRRSRHRQDHLRRALGHPERAVRPSLTVASVRLCTGSNGLEWIT